MVYGWTFVWSVHSTGDTEMKDKSMLMRFLLLGIGIERRDQVKVYKNKKEDKE